MIAALKGAGETGILKAIWPHVQTRPEGPVRLGAGDGCAPAGVFALTALFGYAGPVSELDRRQQQLVLHEPAESTSLWADPPRLLQVLVNLLSNASKYSPQNSEIEVQIGQHDTTLRLAVADRGAGIPSTERINLFRRFVRLDGPEGEQYGVGLGLYVVKHTVEAHRGRVGVEDRPGGGSVFWVELPLEKEIERVRD